MKSNGIYVIIVMSVVYIVYIIPGYSLLLFFLSIVLTDTLDKRGVLGQLKARVRAEVFAALDDQNEPRPVLSHENLLINEMIREYLEFNKYRYTSSVLTAGTVLMSSCSHL